MKYQVVIGLEVHTQLTTNTKIFCGCSTRFGAQPNSQTCPVCLGFPGALPVLNQKVVEYAIRAGLATNCSITPRSVFARKNYFYPDLPKGYQISQFDLPICQHGHLDIEVEGVKKRIGITRIHMEEDAGKLVHADVPGIGDDSCVDLNRACTPLLEVVSEPDMRSPDEAIAYLKKLHQIVVYLGICDGNLEEGSFRCDANVSLMPVGSNVFGTRAELKNINSFKFIKQAIEYEIERQAEILDEGGKVIQETRLFDPNTGTTRSMRGKEEAHDYRYFPDPDLVPVIVSDAWIEEVRATLPELPEAKLHRYVSELGLSENIAEALISSHDLAILFERWVDVSYNKMSAASSFIALLASAKPFNAQFKEFTKTNPGATLQDFGHSLFLKPTSSFYNRVKEYLTTPSTSIDDYAKKLFPRKLANFLLGDVTRKLNEQKQSVKDFVVFPIKAEGAVKLILLEEGGIISGKIAKDLVDDLWQGKDPEEAVEEKGLVQVSDTGAIEAMVDEVLEKNPGQVAEYRNGKETLLGFFVGQVMKASKGKANPGVVNELLLKKLKG